MKNTFNTKNWKSYYINLDHREDRRQHIERVFKKVGIKAERLSGKTDNDVVNFPEIKLASICKTPDCFNNKKSIFLHSPGNWGCTLSHYSILKKHLDSKDKRILAIFEDDAYFSEDFNERLKYLQDNFDLDWDFFYLGSWCRLIKDEKTKIKYVWRIRDIVLGGHGYLVNPKSLPKIIELVKEKAKETEIIDSIYCHLIPYLKMYAFIPGMVSQIVDKSDIKNSKGNYPAFFIKTYGEHIFSNKLKDFKYYKTSKLYFYWFYFVLRIINLIGHIGIYLKLKIPYIYKILKPYFPDKIE